MDIASAETFIRTLAREGSQRAAGKALGCSQSVVHDRFVKARIVLGDEYTLRLLNESSGDQDANARRSLDRNNTTCSCGALRTPSGASGKLVCRPCANRRNKEYKARNVEKIKADGAAYYRDNQPRIKQRRDENKAAISAADAAYYAANKERLKAAARRYREDNKDKLKAYFKALDQTPDRKIDNRVRLTSWKKRNPDKVNAQTAKRYAKKLRALPSWADLKDIEDIYALARLRTELTGIEWHVDHTVPLNSPLVCGLHCEANLQVIPAGPNISKGNNWWPDMPDAPKHATTFSVKPSLYLHYNE